MPLLNLSNRMLRHRPCVPVLVNSLIFSDAVGARRATIGEGKKGARCSLTPIGLNLDPATMRLTKRLVKVVMDSIKAHQSWTCSSKNCVEVRSVIIHQTSNVVDNFRCFGDVLLEETECVWIGNHHGTVSSPTTARSAERSIRPSSWLGISMISKPAMVHLPDLFRVPNLEQSLWSGDVHHDVGSIPGSNVRL